MARALLLTAAVLGTMATAAAAQPSPYAAGGDRYGASAPASLAGHDEVAMAPQANAPLRGRVLTWPGKVEGSARTEVTQPRPVAVAAPGWAGAPARAAYLRPPAPAQAYRAAASRPSAWAPPVYAAAPRSPQVTPAKSLAVAPTQGWRPVFATPTPAAAPSTTPVAASAAPTYARAAPPNRAWAADRRYGYDPTQDHAVRFYSVARPFGLKPDPAPIPPQFFTASADLSGGDPPGPLPVDHTTAAARAAVVGGSDASVQ